MAGAWDGAPSSRVGTVDKLIVMHCFSHHLNFPTKLSIRSSHGWLLVGNTLLAFSYVFSRSLFLERHPGCSGPQVNPGGDGPIFPILYIACHAATPTMALHQCC